MFEGCQTLSTTEDVEPQFFYTCDLYVLTVVA